MLLGEQLKSNESMEIEYKEFCFKRNIYSYFSKKQIKHILLTGKLDESFNSKIYDNIKMYFHTYVPKYASAFYNSNINNGVLKIGINDNGEVTGIPYIGNLDEMKCKSLLKESMKYINTNINDISINLNINKLNINHYILNDNIEYYIEKMQKQKEKYKRETNHYYNIRKEWINEVLKYSVKLSTIIENEETKIKFYKWLDSQECIMIEKIKQTKPYEIESINRKRSYINNKDHIIYWIAKYKDEHMEKLQSIKPKVPNIQKIFNGYVYLITHLTDLRLRLIMNNRQLNYYIITITYKGYTEKKITYRKENNKNYISYRYLKDNSPSSNTIEIN